MAHCLDDPVQMSRLIDPALCHGVAGVLATTWYMARDAAVPGLAERIPDAALLAELASEEGTAARNLGLADPAVRWSGAVLYDGGTLAYLTAHAATTPDNRLAPGTRLTRPNTRLTINW